MSHNRFQFDDRPRTTRTHKKDDSVVWAIGVFVVVFIVFIAIPATGLIIYIGLDEIKKQSAQPPAIQQKTKEKVN